MFIIYSLVRDDNSVAKILIDFPFKNINIDPIKSLKSKVSTGKDKMPARLEIRLKPELVDAEGTGVSRKASAYFGLNVTDTRVIRVLAIDADLNSDQDRKSVV